MSCQNINKNKNYSGQAYSVFVVGVGSRPEAKIYQLQIRQKNKQTLEALPNPASSCRGMKTA